MMPLSVALVFFGASVLLGLAPGPDNLFVLTQSALRGSRAGLLVTLGLSTGLLVHTSAVAFGVAVIFATSAVAFTALKLVGAAYLLYLAWGALRAGATRLGAGKAAELTGLQLYRRGIFMNVTNPKVSIFFLAFLPQFADPARGPVALQIILLGAIFIVATLLVFGGIALLAGYIGEWLKRSDQAQLWLNRITGVLFIGLALRLATAQQN